TRVGPRAAAFSSAARPAPTTWELQHAEADAPRAAGAVRVPPANLRIRNLVHDAHGATAMARRAAILAGLAAGVLAAAVSVAQPGSESGPSNTAAERVPRAASTPRLPTVASINLCTDQLVLHVADPAQIVTLSWLAADPDESTLAEAASRYPLNYGSAEELLRYAPDVVIAGLYTNAFTRALLRDLGFTVVDVAPANSLEDIEAQLRQVAAAIGRIEHGEQLIREMQARIAGHRARLGSSPVDTVVVRPGGFTVEAPSLADELLQL